MKKRTCRKTPNDVSLVCSIFAYQFLKKYKIDDILSIPKTKRTQEMKLWLSMYKIRVLKFRKYESPLNDVKNKINTYLKAQRPFKIFYILKQGENFKSYKYDEYLPTPNASHRLDIGFKNTKLIALRFNTKKDIIQFYRYPNISGDKMLELQHALVKILNIRERNIKLKDYTSVE